MTSLCTEGHGGLTLPVPDRTEGGDQEVEKKAGLKEQD